LERIRTGNIGSYVESVTGDPTEENILKQMRVGPYGRCVFACDNNVADHQVVNMDFVNGATAVFTLAGCSKFGERRTTIFGSEGELNGDGERIYLHTYIDGKTVEVPVPPVPEYDHHGGGDFNLVQEFVNAVRTRNTAGIVSGPEVSLETHYLVFAAEAARKENRIVDLQKGIQEHGLESLLSAD